MALSKENLIQLIALQGQDTALDKIKSEMDKAPAAVNALKEKLAAGKARLAQSKASGIDLEKKKRAKELELAQKEEAAKKHSLELNQVKANDAFKALLSEIDRAKAEASATETEILETMEELDSSRKEEKAFLVQFSVEEKEINAGIAELDAKLREWAAQFESAKAVRDQAAVLLPSDAMRIYDHVRSRGKLNAVVAIEGSNCSACRINLAPQVIVEATKAKQLVTCESCQRILYRPEALVARAPI